MTFEYECKFCGITLCKDCHNKTKGKEDQLFYYEYIEKQEDVRKHIKQCEGRHTQQAIYSTFHDGLTQICFGCMKVRSTIKPFGYLETYLTSQKPECTLGPDCRCDDCKEETEFNNSGGADRW